MNLVSVKRRKRKTMPLLKGRRIKERREQLGMTQVEFAKKIKISTRQLQRIEAGESDVTGDTFIKIANALSASLDYLSGTIDQPTEHLKDPDWTPAERQLMHAYRSGDLSTVLGMLSEKFRDAFGSDPRLAKDK
jgi:transcriptional regulator with XRE-family HTH domain